MGGGVYSGDAGAQDWEKHLAELLGCLALSIIGGVEPTTWNDSFHIENNTAGFLRCIHKECALWFYSTGRRLYGFICCIFSCGCKGRCRSGQYLQPA